MVEARKGVSLNPDDFVAGGLIDDVTATWKTARFAMFDYGGKSTGGPAPCLKLELVGDDGTEYDPQYYSVGNAKDWEPSPDGKTLIPVGNATALRQSTNASILFQSLVNAQFPKDKISDDVSMFDGLVCHMIQVAAPKRAGLEPTPRADGRVFEKTLLVVDKIIKLPWEKTKGKAAGGGGKAAAKVDTPAADNAELEGEAVAAVLELLQDGEIPRKNLPVKIMQVRAKHPQRNAILALFYSDVFLGREGQPWKYEDGIVKSL